jgi:hypothetical protein
MRLSRPVPNLKERSGLESWIGDRVLVVAVALPSVGEGRAPVEETAVVVVEESGEETAEIRMELGARWHRTDREGQKAAVERKIGDGRRVGRKWRRAECPFGTRERQFQGGVGARISQIITVCVF